MLHGLHLLDNTFISEGLARARFLAKPRSVYTATAVGGGENYELGDSQHNACNLGLPWEFYYRSILKP